MSEIESYEVGNSHIEFILKKGEDNLENCILITGFYGIGRCGFISVNHMVEKLGARRIGAMLTDYLPPFLSVKDDRLVLPFEIYRYKHIVFLSVFFEPYKYEHRSFAHAIVKWAKNKKMNHLLLIGGLDSRLQTDPEISAKAVYTNSFDDIRISKPIPIMEEGLFITGPMALVLMYAELEEFPAMGVLPYAERSRPDPIAASKAVQIISDLIKLECGVEELIQEAESIENELHTMEDMIKDSKEEDRNRGMFL